MRFVDFATFVKLPAGTLFVPVEDGCPLGNLSIKYDEGYDNKSTITPVAPEGHFFNGVISLIPWNIADLSNILNLEMPSSFEICDNSNVDYYEYKNFLIFSSSDLDRLIKLLEWARKGCNGKNPGEVDTNEQTFI